MNKKIIALFLVSVMLLVVLTGCSGAGEGAITKEGERTTLTLAIWIPTDPETTAESIAAVQEAINKITTSKYQTAIELNAISRDEYDAKLNARLDEIAQNVKKLEADKKKGIAQPEPETYEISNGVTSVTYPRVTSTQLDLFLVSGFDKYTDYISNDQLISVDAEIAGESKLLRENIYPTFLEFAKVDGATFAVPNNHMIGEYDFLLINKKLVDELYYDIDQMSTLNLCRKFILDVAENTDVTPILAKADAQSMVFLSSDGKESVIGFQELDGTANSTLAYVTNVLRLPEYTDNIYNMKDYAEKGLFAADPENCKEFGVGIIRGGAEVIDEYGDEYFIKIHNRPIARNDDIFGAMFGVSQYTKNISRTMEFLTLLNTDTEIRTILQYGVQGVHWDYEDDDHTTIKKLSDTYKMKLIETGNTFVTYPDYGKPISSWESAKAANLDSTTSPFLRVTGYVNDDSLPYFEKLAKLSADIFGRIDEMSAEEFKSSLADLRKEINNDESYKWLINNDAENVEYQNNLINTYYNYYMTAYPDLFGK